MEVLEDEVEYKYGKGFQIKTQIRKRIEKRRKRKRVATRMLKILVNSPDTVITFGYIVSTIQTEKSSKAQPRISRITMKTVPRLKTLRKTIISINICQRKPELCLGQTIQIQINSVKIKEGNDVCIYFLMENKAEAGNNIKCITGNESNIFLVSFSLR